MRSHHPEKRIVPRNREWAVSAMPYWSPKGSDGLVWFI